MGWGEKRWKINWAASTGDGKSGGGQVCYFYVFITALSSAVLMAVAQAGGIVGLAMSATFMYCCSLLMVAVAQTEGKVGLAKAAWQAFH